MKKLIVLVFAYVGFSYAAGSKPPQNQQDPNQNPLEQIKTPTPFQTECQKNLPTKPQKIVVAFDGLNGYDAKAYQDLKISTTPPALHHQESPPSKGAELQGMIGQGAMQVNDIVWYYFGEDSISDTGLQDPVRCAYEFATHAYENGQGQKIYSTISVFGFSFGGHATLQMVNQLKELNVAVNLVVTADPRSKNWPGSIKYSKPESVGIWNNFYQHNSFMLKGQLVEGADSEENLSPKGYTHQWMPGSDEVTKKVRDELNSLSLCRATPADKVSLSDPDCR